MRLKIGKSLKSFRPLTGIIFFYDLSKTFAELEAQSFRPLTGIIFFYGEEVTVVWEIAVSVPLRGLYFFIL